MQKAASQNQLKEAFRQTLEKNSYYLYNTRAERFKAAPLKTLYRALIKRIYSLLIYKFRILPVFSTIRTFYGRPLTCAFPASLSLRTLGAMEGEEMLLTYFVLSAVAEDDTFIDGGAHVGFYALLASELVGESGRVFAFEPTPRTFGILKENALPYKNIHPEQKALWSRSGKQEFVDLGPYADIGNTIVRDGNPNKESMNLGEKINVDAVSLDNYCLENGIKPAFIKLDLEGNDIEAIKGAEKIIRETLPIVTVEIQSGNILNGDCAAIIKILSSYSYSPFRINKRGQLYPFVISADPDFDYVNLVFLSKGREGDFSPSLIA